MFLPHSNLLLSSQTRFKVSTVPFGTERYVSCCQLRGTIWGGGEVSLRPPVMRYLKRQRVSWHNATAFL